MLNVNKDRLVFNSHQENHTYTLRNADYYFKKKKKFVFSSLPSRLFLPQTHKIDSSSHYLRLKMWIDNRILFYVPKIEEDISDLVRKHTLKHLDKNEMEGICCHIAGCLIKVFNFSPNLDVMSYLDICFFT